MRSERSGDDDAATALAGMDEDHLLCRDLGHAWRPHQAQWVPQRRQFVETLRCTRCKGERARLLGEHGELLANRYTYADGYLMHGLGRLTGDGRNMLRLAGLEILIRRTS